MFHGIEEGTLAVARTFFRQGLSWKVRVLSRKVQVSSWKFLVSKRKVRFVSFKVKNFWLPLECTTRDGRCVFMASAKPGSMTQCIRWVHYRTPIHRYPQNLIRSGIFSWQMVQLRHRKFISTYRQQRRNFPCFPLKKENFHSLIAGSD
jgi:hypothetical protein